LSRKRLLSRAPANQFLEPAVVLGGLPELGSEIVVLGEDSLDAAVGEVVLQAADASEQLADLADPCGCTTES
jgi:hypothetical protein